MGAPLLGEAEMGEIGGARVDLGRSLGRAELVEDRLLAIPLLQEGAPVLGLGAAVVQGLAEMLELGHHGGLRGDHGRSRLGQAFTHARKNALLVLDDGVHGGAKRYRVPPVEERAIAGHL